MTARALVIAAPSSGAGKTVVSLGLMRALRDAGYAVRAAKSGPDYIDPAFHAAATGAPSVNLDAWAMDPDTLRTRAASQGGDLLVIEAAMGVLDAGADGKGSAADLARTLAAPVVLVLDVAKQGQSAGMIAAGFHALCPDLTLAGVILNRVGSARHERIVRGAVEAAGTAVLGVVPRTPDLALPERHLGLVQAGEHTDLAAFLTRSADMISNCIDLGAIHHLARPLAASEGPSLRLPPLGQRIALAQDKAFAFAYPHLLTDWHAMGAEVLPFSPLANEAPDPSADAIYLPGGYPELHAGRLASAQIFRSGMRAAMEKGARVYGECGGFMVLGESLIDAEGKRHEMLGALPVETSFAQRKLSLGYRRLTPNPGAPWSAPLLGHEFHYATVIRQDPGNALFEAEDAEGNTLASMGLSHNNVSGSFAHIIGLA